MEWRRSVREATGGVALEVEVVPGSRESRFPAGFNSWRGRLEAKVRAPPEDGLANEELCALAAEALGLARGAVSVTSGATSRRKTLTARGIDVAGAVARLAGRLDRP